MGTSHQNANSLVSMALFKSLQNIISKEFISINFFKSRDCLIHKSDNSASNQPDEIQFSLSKVVQ
jgi:hypothetical protein